MEHVLSPGARRAWNRLWLLDHVLGRRRVNQRWPELRQAVHERVGAELLALPPGGGEPVERRPAPDRDVFIQEVVRRDRPVVLSGAAADWPALQRWSFRFFIEHYGDVPVQLIRAAVGDDGSDRSGMVRPLGAALEEAMTGGGTYPRFVPLLHKFPELRHDLDMAWLAAMRGPWLERLGMTLQLFLGGPGSTTALHNALSSNLFIQLQGRKRWHIVSSAWTPALDPALNRSPYFFSDVDMEAPDHQRFPWLSRVRYWVVELEPGDVLYHPPFFWHQVRNEGHSVGVGFRYYDPAAMLRASAIQTALTALAIDPPIWKAAQLKGDFSQIFAGTWRGNSG